MALTPKQRKFVAAYVDNATEAARTAGYKGNDKTLSVVGSENLAKPEIAAAIAVKTGKVLEAIGAPPNSVLTELAHFAHSDIGEAFDKEGVLLPLHKMPSHVRRAIKSFEVEELYAQPLDDGAQPLKIGRTVKVALWPKDRGLELLGKNQKLFTDKVEHTGLVKIEVVDPYAKAKP